MHWNHNLKSVFHTIDNSHNFFRVINNKYEVRAKIIKRLLSLK